ncbi:hypothetical protein [Salinigranum halophilum]|uniref:hypothetical protein n=1 Tax=Salinigranum halophilum TaxID=2565931 RepID=UPI00115DF28A|nr:hypothetical protein [Salinigranum halophilum]
MGSVESAPGESTPGIGDRVSSLLPGLERWRDTKNMGHVRLRADVAAYREEFETLVARTNGDGTFWQRDVTDLLDEVDEALERGRVEDGWRHFHAAQRLETHGLEALDEAEGTNALEAQATAVREEALDTLGGWRKRAVEALLGQHSLDADVTGEDLRVAMTVLHEQYESVHLKQHYLQQQFTQLFQLGTVAGVVFIVCTLAPTFLGVEFFEPPFDVATTDAAAAATVTSPGFAVFVALAGMIGASLFGMRSLQKQTVSTKVAQRITGLGLTWARGLIGAISALVFYFFLQTPFTGDFGQLTPAVMIVVGFAAGYSERMVSRAVETVSGATTEPKES